MAFRALVKRYSTTYLRALSLSLSLVRRYFARSFIYLSVTSAADFQAVHRSDAGYFLPLSSLDHFFLALAPSRQASMNSFYENLARNRPWLLYFENCILSRSTIDFIRFP